MSAGPATAATPDCPTAPAAYTGTDAVAAAVTQLDADVVATCSATTARLDRLHDDVAAASDLAHTDAAGIHSDGQAVAADVRQVHDDVTHLSQAFGAAGSAPATVTVTNPPDTTGVTAAVTAEGDSVGNALHSDLWFCIGLVASLLCGYVLYRQVMPRA